MKHLSKILATLLINLTLSAPTYAEIMEQKDFNFKFNSEKLMKGDIYYSFRMVRPKQLKKKYPELAEMDTLGILKKSDVGILISKVVYIVNKPIGFFDHKQMIDADFIKHMLDGQKSKQLSEETYKVTVGGNTGHSFQMEVYFDSDDVSTLPNSKVVRAVTAGKKLDVISQSAPAILFKEYSDFTKFQEGAVSMSSFVPLKENKTMVITYHVGGVKKDSISKGLEQLFVNEVGNQKKLIESYNK